MNVLAHRGLWKDPDERNTPDALRRALEEGFGLETDIRDAHGSLVISHDPPVNDVPRLADLLEMRRCVNRQAPLALNIKADGLAARLRKLLASEAGLEYFCFDMSVPEMRVYVREGIRVFTRESELEPTPALYNHACGAWLDMFQEDWVKPADIQAHLDAGKLVALVSPELHGRPHLEFWSRLRAAGLAGSAALMLCTDHPVEARDFFA